jgi:hypothetical protein
VDIDEADAAQGWPLKCVITAASDSDGYVEGKHPSLPRGSRALIGEAALLVLRHQFDTPPRIANEPAVYVMVVVPEVRPVKESPPRHA